MDQTGFGTAVMLAIAAVLWLVYLMPSWVRRREYLATERNAVRLQQTLRVMAETAETPAQVHTEAQLRDIAEQERQLRRLEKQRRELAKAREAEAAAAAARTLSSLQPDAAASAARRRSRATRAVVSLVMLVSLVVGGAQSVSAAAAGTLSAGALLVLAVSTGVFLGGMAAHSRLTAVNRARTARARSTQAAFGDRPAPRVYDAGEESVDESLRPAREWTPVPLPKPLYLSKPQVETPAMAERDLVAEVKAEVRAAVQAEVEAQVRAEAEQRQADLVAAHAEPEVVPINDAARSRFARMGVIDDIERPVTDIDAALRRRRASAG
ncbi:hypothetical protein [Ruicaihuangia caeni]|uniref:hypothetical protein n=1 Tax=Ruicaihuangia caeni TaxID=3042517 RepID=UPI00338E2B49